MISCKWHKVCMLYSQQKFHNFSAEEFESGLMVRKILNGSHPYIRRICISLAKSNANELRTSRLRLVTNGAFLFLMRLLTTCYPPRSNVCTTGKKQQGDRPSCQQNAQPRILRRLTDSLKHLIAAPTMVVVLCAVSELNRSFKRLEAGKAWLFQSCRHHEWRVEEIDPVAL